MERVHALFDAMSRLTAVVAYQEEDLIGPTLIHFVFSDAEFAITVDPDTDEVLFVDRPGPQHLPMPSSAVDVFRPALLHKCITDVWSMTNKQGYSDAIQLQFAEPDARPILLQFVAMASGFWVYSVQRLEAPPP